MCGRFNLTLTTEQIAAHFSISNAPEATPRYNIAPAQDILAIVPIDSGERAAVFFRWGLIPSWSKEIKIGNRLINARAETVAEKPAFRSAFKKRRCLIPATGFYEWRKRDGYKQPYHVHMDNDEPFCFAGLWEYWEGTGKSIQSCTLLTADANALMAPIHDRMPVILPANAYAVWLDRRIIDPARLKPLLQPCSMEHLVAERISTRVNNPANDDPLCIKPIR
jgi:putative SOS response-associated peptidase YedK